MVALINSRLLGTFALLITIFFLNIPTYAQYGGGTGEPNDPYLIYTPEQMNEIGLHEEDWDKQFKLIADIDLSAYKGSAFNIIGTLVGAGRNASWKPFTGVFDGNGHVISNFTYTVERESSIGFFRCIDGPNAEIRNLGLIDPNLTGKECSCVGSLVAYFRAGAITNCYVKDVAISGDDEIGGLVGSNHGTITNCHVEDGIISGDEAIGGLVGRNNGTITHCSVEGCTVSGDWEIGGLVGQSSSGTVTNCCCTGTVSGNDRVGGLVGCIERSSVNECYSTGMISGRSYVGGLVGYKQYGTIETSYSVETVEGVSAVGGLVGQHGNGTIKDCYSDGSVDGVSAVGGLVGHNDDRISNSYTSTNVTGQQDVGGLVGRNVAASIGDAITNCYSTGIVDGEVNVGGLVGFNLWPERVTRSFWDVQISGQEHSAGGEGKTTTQMQTAVTFLAWAASDNEGTWTIDEGNDYPRLWWEGTPGTTIEPARLAGTGTEDDPYLIYTVHDLSSIGLLSSEWDKHFKLMADIDLSVHTGTTFNIIQSFSGIFDGNGHVVSNLTYTLQEFKYPDFNEPFFPNVSHVGLFGNVGGLNAEIKNLGLVNPNVSVGTGDYVGALAGYVGGIGATIANCYVEGGTVAGGGWSGVGGLVGHNEYGSILKCYATVDVFGDFGVGGLVGYNDRGSITDCYARGGITGSGSVGGLVGLNDASPGGGIRECYSTGNVNGNSSTGGLVGSGSFVSGCFWDIETSGQEVSAGGIGMTTADMQIASTFLDAGWDFVDETENGTEDIWKMWDGYDYPRLSWEPGPNTPLVFVDINDPGFYGQMSKYEVTNAQYCDFLNAALASGDIAIDGNDVYGAGGLNSGEDYIGERYYRCDGSGYTGYGATNGGAARIYYSEGAFSADEGFGNHPVTYVSWYGAMAFTNYYGYYLPTEEQWQAVADYDGTYIYGCGQIIDPDIANYRISEHPDGTTPVGSFGIYGYGMSDVAGNVWEWTSSSLESNRVFRGGSLGSIDSDCDVSIRGEGIPNANYWDIGFRVCR